jgi:hypothetical protein
LLELYRRLFQILLVTLVSLSLETFLPSRLVAEEKAGSNLSNLAVLSAYGTVEINGDPALSGTVIFPGTAVSTGNDSTAVINLGTLGRIEVLPRTRFKVTFSANKVNCAVESGTLRVSVARGGTANVSTPDGTVANESGSDARFTVSADNGSSFSTFTGNINLKEGNIRQVAQESVFRPSLTAQATGENHGTNPSSGDVNQGLAVLLVCVGTVLAAVAGFAPPYDSTFYRVGGPSSVQSVNPLAN